MALSVAYRSSHFLMLVYYLLPSVQAALLGSLHGTEHGLYASKSPPASI